MIIAHRVTIIISLAVLMLAVMRRLLPGGIAGLFAAWWVVAPNVFDAMYEIHSLSVLLVLAATLLAGSAHRLWSRAAAFATLVVGVVLVRNELLAAVPLVCAALLCYERAHPTRGRTPGALRRALPACVACLAAAGAVLTWFYARASDAPVLGHMLRGKHELTVGQTYAVGYNERRAWRPRWCGCFLRGWTAWNWQTVIWRRARPRDNRAIAGLVYARTPWQTTGRRFALARALRLRGQGCTLRGSGA